MGIYVKTHQINISKEQEEHAQKALSSLLEHSNDVRLVNAAGTKFTFRLKGELVVATNSTFTDADKGQHTNTLKIDGKSFAVNHLYTYNERHISLRDDNGAIFVQYDKEIKEVKVLFDLFSLPNWKELLDIVILRIGKMIEQEKHANSWKHGDKARLISVLVDAEQRELEDKKRNANDRVQRAKNRIEDYKSEIVRSFKDLKSAEELLAHIAKGSIEPLRDKVSKEFDRIASMARVSELEIKDKKVYVHIGDTYCYHDQTDERYYIGDFILRFDLESADVRFQNTNNKRRSHWGEGCHHPHVDEKEWGYACLGNVESTIAELVSQKEYYALVMVLIDFLESVNTSDVAGEHIRFWDVVDENGNIIREASDSSQVRCEYCEEPSHEDDMRTVITHVDSDGDAQSAEEWCVCCADDNSYYDEETGDTYSEDAYYDLLEARKEAERFKIITEIDEDGDEVDYAWVTEDEAEGQGYSYVYSEELGDYATLDVIDKLERLENESEDDE